MLMLTVNQAFKQILKTKAGYCSLPGLCNRRRYGLHNHTFCLLETREGTGCTITRSVYLKPEKVRVAQSHVMSTCKQRRYGLHNHTFCLLETREGTGCKITRSVYLKPEKVRVAQSHVLST